MAITDKHIESHTKCIIKALYTDGLYTNYGKLLLDHKEIEVAIDRDMSNGTKVIVIINLPQ